MAHELEMNEDGTASMFYAGDTPWHSLGTKVDHLLTASEALEAAGLDWTVEKMPLSFTDEDGFSHPVADRFATVRATDKKYLGVVGPDYKPYQNSEAFSFFDTVVDSGEAKYETAGSLFGGKRVWMTAKIGETMTICGEEHDMYLLLSNSHDGSRALTAATSIIRVVCANTETMALRGAKTKWTLRHRVSLEGKAEEARTALQLAFKNASAFKAEVEKLLAVEVDKDLFTEIVSSILPEQKRQKEKNVEQLVSIFESEPTVVDTDAAGNGWGAYNALSFWLDRRKMKSAEGRMLSLTEGYAAGLRNKLHERVLSTADQRIAVGV
jgi:phage/plasmid-like protein (TIGR03299 family)